MPLIMYEKLRFTKDVQKTIDQANEIIAEYQAKGIRLTLRSLYYQFVARKLVETNTQKQYKRLGDTLSKARIGGVVDWFSFSDTTRYMSTIGFQPDKEYIPYLTGCADAFNIDMWQNQKCRPLVLIEKDALIGSVEGVCSELEIPYFAARGYMSQSAQWRLGMQLREWKADGYEPIIFHLGDHDPSGMDMTRDNEERLWMFGGFPVELVRLALNMDQVEKYNPPPMWAKPKDSRTGKYKENFGKEVWELDALDPTIIGDLIREAVMGIRDEKAWDERVKERDQQQSEIKAMVATLSPPPPPEPRDVYKWYGVPDDE